MSKLPKVEVTVHPTYATVIYNGSNDEAKAMAKRVNTHFPSIGAEGAPNLDQFQQFAKSNAEERKELIEKDKEDIADWEEEVRKLEQETHENNNKNQVLDNEIKDLKKQLAKKELEKLQNDEVSSHSSHSYLLCSTPLTHAAL